MPFTDRLKLLRKENKISQKKLGEYLGVSQNAVFNWENGKTEPSAEMITKISEYFNIAPAYLMGWEEHEQLPSPHYKRKGIVINVYGRVSAGVPIEMIEDIIDTEEIDPEMAKTGTFFGLKIRGDSMTPRIEDGDIVIVRQQEDAESGDIVIATINGDEATCKRLRKFRDGIELIANNPNYEPLFFTDNEIIEKPIKIIGKVMELRRIF